MGGDSACEFANSPHLDTTPNSSMLLIRDVMQVPRSIYVFKRATLLSFASIIVCLALKNLRHCGVLICFFSRFPHRRFRRSKYYELTRKFFHYVANSRRSSDFLSIMGGTLMRVSPQTIDFTINLRICANRWRKNTARRKKTGRHLVCPAPLLSPRSLCESMLRERPKEHNNSGVLLKWALFWCFSRMWDYWFMAFVIHKCR